MNHLLIITLLLQSTFLSAANYVRSNSDINSIPDEQLNFQSFSDTLNELQDNSHNETVTIPFSCSSEVEQKNQFKECDNSNIFYYHAKAIEKLESAIQLMDSEKNRPQVLEAMKIYFKISSMTQESELVQKVFSNIQKVQKNAQYTKYKCHKSDRSKSLWCSKNNLAIVPPPKHRVHLCPAYFESLSEDQKIGTLLHEWFHRWAGGNIDYYPEKYCHQMDDNVDAKKLIKTADQYMMFLFNVGNQGEKLHCF